MVGEQTQRMELSIDVIDVTYFHEVIGFSSCELIGWEA